MKELSRTQRSGVSRFRLVLAPALSLTALAFSATAAFAIGTTLAPSLKVETERTTNGAKVTLTGKGFPANGRIKITSTRPPGGGSKLDFGTFSADSSGAFKANKTMPCTSRDMEDARDPMTVTATDSASNTSISQKIEGAAWVCQ